MKPNEHKEGESKQGVNKERLLLPKDNWTEIRVFINGAKNNCETTGPGEAMMYG